jgi:hypothetical protein
LVINKKKIVETPAATSPAVKLVPQIRAISNVAVIQENITYKE